MHPRPARRSNGSSDHPADPFRSDRPGDDRAPEHGDGDGFDPVPEARAIAATLATTLGPNGLDKLLIDRGGTALVTNTGATVLDALEIDSPIGRVVRDAVSTHGDRVGDGTTTTAVLIGALLAEAERLRERGVHPISIADGYATARRNAIERVRERSTPVGPGDDRVLQQVARTAVTGRWDETAADRFADLAVGAIRGVGFDAARLTVHAYPGGGLADAETLDGVLVDTDASSTAIDDEVARFPRRIDAPAIAAVDGGLSPRSGDVEATVSVDDAEGLTAIHEHGRRSRSRLVDAVCDAGTDVVVCQRAVDDAVRTSLARRGVLAIERARRDEFDAIARASGAQTVTEHRDLTPDALGAADAVRRRTIGGTPAVALTGLPNESHVSVVVRGGTDHVAEETRRIVDDCVVAIRHAVSGGIVPGGGAGFVDASRSVSARARGIDDRSALAVEAFADALEAVPRTLARNAASDPIDVLATLRARHDGGQAAAGIDRSGAVRDVEAAGVFDPAAVLTGCLATASETAIAVLRIDDALVAGGSGPDADCRRGPDADRGHGCSHDHGHGGGRGSDRDGSSGEHAGYPWALSH
ncbi:chaperonin Cpn60 [Halorubrum sp. JWXQ-INN 858]|uniref:TCP-1/cpn60 chaperonin family protein n=1 Tax=Halorubrum sp. JWXQ-INN 858 TaxID=2690782 RepID=UPI00135CAE1A|nr:TCP-1/cpn60 chaperonin family protein [Halorubrum sp. JWXQ-INN 858]MWV64240.1 chaperonin Cpn60 [Halorubrum sp. JWXQ-INN 858]